MSRFKANMDIYNKYKDYKKYYPDYLKWKEEQDTVAAKRAEYLKNNPDKVSKNDIQRGKILLHAIDVMDEYSQTRAEDMEIATDLVSGEIVSLSTTLGMMIGLGLTALKPVQKYISKIATGKNSSFMVLQMIPSMIGMVVGFIASFPAIIWATNTKVGASRRGRFEAMRKDLNSPNSFALLNDVQLQKVEKDSKNIELDDIEKKRLENKKALGANPFAAFKTLKNTYKEKEEYQKQKAEFDKNMEESEKNFDKPLTESEKLLAKKDQQILADLVRKIDVASQDYAGNAELATNTFTTLAFAGGGLVGWISNKIIKGLHLKGNKIAQKAIPYGTGLAVALGTAMYAASIQKQASRIGRYKVKQEMLNNPESLVYVDEKDSDSIKDIKPAENKKRPNIFKFLVQLIKDNKEYTQYRKTEMVEELKRHKAAENLKLAGKQLEDAKALQMNVFKTFNKVDEKSQLYSESVEGVGKLAQQTVSYIGATIATIVSSVTMICMLNKPNGKFSGINYFTKTLLPFFLVPIPVIALDIYTTKEQKKASRVADMLALKELNDYRHYANYKDNKETQVIAQSNETNLLKRLSNK